MSTMRFVRDHGSHKNGDVVSVPFVLGKELARKGHAVHWKGDAHSAMPEPEPEPGTPSVDPEPIPATPEPESDDLDELDRLTRPDQPEISAAE